MEQPTYKIFNDYKSGKISSAELADICGRKLEDENYIHTQNFGWVRQEDYDRFSFLRRDKGVPVVERKVLELKNKNVVDKFGNEERKKVPVKKIAMFFDDEWVQYQKLLKARELER